MVQAIKSAKDFPIFNFDVYKNLVMEYIKKIDTEVNDQIKCLNELEVQIQDVAKNGKMCIFTETPSQQRKRMFVTHQLISSSPVKNGNPGPSFQSIIRPAPARLNHFEDDGTRQKLNFDSVLSNPITPVPKAYKRRVSNRNMKGPPTKRIRNQNSHQSKTGVDSTLKQTSKFLEIKNIEANKQKRRIQAAAVEKRRKEFEEARNQRLIRRQQEKAKRLANVPPSPFIPSLIKPPLRNNPPRDIPKPEIVPNKSRKETFDFKTENFEESKKIQNTPVPIVKIEPVQKPDSSIQNDSVNCYDIKNLQSDDSTDDENSPKKVIPRWASPNALWNAIEAQHRDTILKGEKIFGPIPDVSEIKFFTKASERYHQRTSSAHWEPSIIDTVH